MVEMFGLGVVGIIAVVAAGWVVMNFGAKNEDGDTAMAGDDGPKGIGNYLLFIVAMGIVFLAIANCG